MKKEIKIISDFNTDIFYNYLNNKIDDKCYKIVKPNYEILSSSAYKIISSNKKYHTIIVWSRIEETVKEFSKLIYFEKISKSKFEKELKNYINILLKLSEKTEHLIVTSWILPKLEKGKYLKDFTSDDGLTKNLFKSNIKIADTLKKKSNTHFFNIDFIHQKNFLPSNPKLWFATKTPYNNKLFDNASDEFLEIIESFSKPSKKLLIIDLDNTIWGGEVGELGWKKIKIGGHDFMGEAYLDFQKKIKSLNNKGIQLAIISKNDEKNALQAFKKNKEMFLKLEDFATWRINWNDKAKNLLEITKELNLSTDSCVFIDDNPNERNRIKTSLPDVIVPDWPEDPCYFSEEISKMNCFNNNFITREDKLRTKYYKDEKKRDSRKKNFPSHEEWLASLKIKVKFEKIDDSNKMRVLQLINKTNQMNLMTRRFNESQFENLLKEKNIEAKTLRVSDELGDMGLVGLYILKFKKQEAHVKDFILSCRAFGRSIEKLMAYQIYLSSKKNKLKKIVFKYVKTKKNKPCLTFLKSLENFQNTGYTFIHNNKYKIQKPKHLI